MVGWQGFEPWTNGLKGRCSTAELPTHLGDRRLRKRRGKDNLTWPKVQEVLCFLLLFLAEM